LRQLWPATLKRFENELLDPFPRNQQFAALALEDNLRDVVGRVVESKSS
jgi:hypothetical protein